MHRSFPRRSPTWLAAGMVLLALASLPVSAAPNTVVFDLVIHAGVAELRTGPLVPLPSPTVPNPLYDALETAAPALAPAPVQVEDAPDGFYVQAADQQPVRVVGWAPGIGQRSMTPIEYVAQVLSPDNGLPISNLPVGLAGCACPAQLPSSSPGSLRLPVSLPPPGSSPLGARATKAPLREEAVPPAEASEPVRQDLAPYQAPLALASEVTRAESAGPTPAPGSDSATTIAAVLAAGAALLLLKLLLPLYHRFRRKTALDNPTRARLYEMLRSAPGASAADLGGAAGLHVTTVKYHLDVLRRVGMVGEQVVDGCRRFYSYENGDRMEFLTRALLDEPAAKAVYQQIERHPGLPFIEVARGLGMRKEHVHYHVKKLAKHGLITDRWEAGRRLLFPAVPQGTLAGPAPPSKPSVPEVRA